MNLKLLGPRVAVHCSTYEEAVELCSMLDKEGLKWASKERYLYKNRWDIYKEQTCYNIHGGTYAYKKYYTNKSFDIIQFKELRKNDIYIHKYLISKLYGIQ